uniref:NADH-ubiquinone oxidoreductase chain 2 n=2 Tax=Trichonotus TaxID=270660 RepID=A0A679EM72_9TELE|nr:NADH dehydrogenase subunit 2 [Trichonotus setiger]BAX03916.1 NADH dehydrogenase subunit 2 [Trichonotus elegans]BBU26059.1 NADH dehydrogenase subunit 2 [Trichonotus elegans]
MQVYIKAAFISSLGLGTMTTFAGSHWMFAWAGLEINMLAVLPLMTVKFHPRASEAATKYFLVQATASAAILFAALVNSFMFGAWDLFNMIHPLPGSIMILALTLKIGIAPLHMWLPEVLQGLNLDAAFILATWQKLAPFIMLVQLPSPHPDLLLALGLLSIMAGGWGGMNQTQTRKIMAYSSMAHMGWIMAIYNFSPTLALLTLALYLIMTSAAFLTLKVLNAFSVKGLARAMFNLPMLTALTPMTLLSLGGLPPLSGFAPKWLITNEIVVNKLPLMATIMTLVTLFSLYFYLRLTNSLSLTMSPNSNVGLLPLFLSKSPIAPMLPLVISGSMMLIPLIPVITAAMPACK